VLISTENRIRFLWPGPTSPLRSGFSLALIHFASLDIGALILALLLAGCLFNKSYWPVVGTRSVVD
jgi:hypothetical protein